MFRFSNRYDTENVGVVNGGKLLSKLGINLRATTAPTSDIYVRSPRGGDGEPTSRKSIFSEVPKRMQSVYASTQQSQVKHSIKPNAIEKQ